MRITLDIDKDLLDAVLVLTGEKTKTGAVNKGLAEYVRSRRVAGLQSMAGKIELVDNLSELEELEDKELGRL